MYWVTPGRQGIETDRATTWLAIVVCASRQAEQTRLLGSTEKSWSNTQGSSDGGWAKESHYHMLPESSTMFSWCSVLLPGEVASLEKTTAVPHRGLNVYLPDEGKPGSLNRGVKAVEPGRGNSGRFYLERLANERCNIANLTPWGIRASEGPPEITEALGIDRHSAFNAPTEGKHDIVRWSCASI